MNDILEITKDSDVLLKGVNKTIRNKTKGQKLDFLVCY